MPCKKIAILSILLFSLMPVSGPVHAADAELFQASVPVADQSAAAREQALRNALEVVLVRITGNPLVASSPAAAGLLDNAAHYAGSYRYERRVPSSVETQAQIGELAIAPEPILHLSASFDAAALQRAVRQAGLSFWGSERPETLVWLAVEDGRQLVGDANSGVTAKAHDALQQVARKRGITLIFPLLDTQDRQHVSYTDVWAGFDDRILTASKRYGADTVLVGKLYQVSNGWQAQWHLLDAAGSVTSQWQSLSGPLASVMAGGINPLADAYAARYASHPAQAVAGAGVVEVIISGVTSLTDYGAVLDYVQGLTPVRNLQVAQVADNDLTLQLQLNSSIDQLENAISLGRLLKPAPVEEVALFKPINNTGSVRGTGLITNTGPSGQPEAMPLTQNGTSDSSESAPATKNGAGATVSGAPVEPVVPVSRTVLRYEYQP